MSQTLVLQAIASLVKEGKTPTMAMVKSRLSEPVPMPLLFQTLTRYKSNPAILETIPAGTATSSTSSHRGDLRELEDEVKQLRHQVHQLRQELAQLRALIK